MLIIKIASKIFLTSGYVCPPPPLPRKPPQPPRPPPAAPLLRHPLPSNKIFIALKGMCRKIENNHSKPSL